MTITYTLKVSNSKLCGFSKLLFHWKGSVYKLVYKEMLIFLSLYYTLSIIYRCVLTESQKRVFETVVIYFQSFLNLIPLTFVLGFYVAIVVGRWWNQYLSLPWPDRLMGYVGTLVHGSDERGRVIRRTLMRWLNLSHVMVMQSISIVVKKRFPTLQHLVDAGLMTPHEKRKLKDMPTPHNKFWVPTMWFSTLVTQSMEEGRIRDEIHLKTLLDEVTHFKASLGMLYSFDWISIPLVYTQVTTIAVYGFFFACLMGRQYIENPPKGHSPQGADLYVPLFTLMQFFFYMGWLKVAEVLINPFGEDEDDFESNWIIDRNYQVAMLGADELYGDLPVLEKDMYWDDLEPELPYTKSTICHKNEPFMGSTADFSLDPEDIGSQMVNPMETIPENVIVDQRQQLDIPSSVVTSAVSSPARLRHFFSNITSAFSQESISDGKNKELHLNSLHNVKDGIKDPMFFQSPLLQRVKSNSVKRSHSHTDHLSPKRVGSMCHVNVTGGSFGQTILSHAVPVTSSFACTGHANKAGVTPVSQMVGESYLNGETNLGSMSSLIKCPKDNPLRTTADHFKPGLAGGPCDPSGNFYRKPLLTVPAPGNVTLNNTRPTSLYQQYTSDDKELETSGSGITTADNQPMIFDMVKGQKPFNSELTGENSLCSTDFSAPHTLTNNTHLSAMYSPGILEQRSSNGRPVSPALTSVTRDQGTLSGVGDIQPASSFTSNNHVMIQDVAQCSTVWSETGNNMSPVQVTSGVQKPDVSQVPVFTGSVKDCSSVPPKEQPVKKITWKDDLSPGREKPATSPTTQATTSSQASTLLDLKADSQDSIDSTYDSNYDTVNSQQPLLEASHRWDEDV